MSFVLGLLSGSIVGAAVVILLAPQSGTELRQIIATKYSGLVESGREAIAERRQALQSEYKVRTTRIEIPLEPPQA